MGMMQSVSAAHLLDEELFLLRILGLQLGRVVDHQVILATEGSVELTHSQRALFLANVLLLRNCSRFDNPPLARIVYFRIGLGNRRLKLPFPRGLQLECIKSTRGLFLNLLFAVLGGSC